jgi:hypothetical protein
MDTTQFGSNIASSTLKGSKEETNEYCSQNVVTRDLVVDPILMSPRILSTGWSCCMVCWTLGCGGVDDLDSSGSSSSSSLAKFPLDHCTYLDLDLVLLLVLDHLLE